MGVEGGTSGGGVLLRGQQFLQLGIFLAPAFFRGFKGIRQTAPAHIAGKHLLLFRAGLLTGSLQLLQKLNGVDVCLKLDFRAALTQMVVGNMEILRVSANIGLVFLISGILGSGGIGKGLPLAVDLNRNGMFVQNFIQSFLRLRCRRFRFLNV